MKMSSLETIYYLTKLQTHSEDRKIYGINIDGIIKVLGEAIFEKLSALCIV